MLRKLLSPSIVILALAMAVAACNYNGTSRQKDMTSAKPAPAPQYKVVTPTPPPSPVVIQQERAREVAKLEAAQKRQKATLRKEHEAKMAPARMADEIVEYEAEESVEAVSEDMILSPADIETEEPHAGFNTEEYAHIIENDFRSAQHEPLSTFSIDVDKASYANIRRFLNSSVMPNPGAVRIEEMVNYFDYDYATPIGPHPFAVHTEVSSCPWKPEHQLVHIGLKGMEIDRSELPPSNLVFLLDVSGSMNYPNKLPLLKAAFKLLLNNLNEQDRIAIVVYAGAAGEVLPSTPASDKPRILAALESLQAGGSTAGGEGIQLAYTVAKKNFIPNGNNRVILATDGDFNVGMSSESELVRMIEEKRNDGVYLSVLGFGSGNYKDSRMEQLADKGNGNYAYIDNLLEAQKVLVSEMGGTLYTIAKDVKLQIEFNPTFVKGYRLIGYENRTLANQDFNDDTKDAGELGAGHTVTALYEVIPAGAATEIAGIDELKYQKTYPSNASATDELMTVKLRYKKPTEDVSTKLEHVVMRGETTLSATSDNFRFSAAVASFGMILRGSKYKGEATYTSVREMAKGALGEDLHGYRTEFLSLVEKARLLDNREMAGK